MHCTWFGTFNSGKDALFSKLLISRSCVLKKEVGVIDSANEHMNGGGGGGGGQVKERACTAWLKSRDSGLLNKESKLR
jgi:hypothetical protein